MTVGADKSLDFEFRVDASPDDVVQSVQFGGEGGIRTHGARRHNGFRDRPDKPLPHLSAEVGLISPGSHTLGK